ncbi:MAG: hypothetical protein M1819_004227 [Sarea resinae]|nr:MAG: hypothetical protein M1819_004227 [Sarea resinae]
MKSGRAFLGWCRIAEQHLGTKDAKYDNIDWSATPGAGKTFRIVGGSVGFQQFGVGELDFAFGRKDSKLHLSRQGPFQSVITAASKTPVVLYDAGEKRAWLVDAASIFVDDPGSPFRGRDYCFRDLFLDTWSKIEGLLDQDVNKSPAQGVALSATMQDRLLGWEFMDLVDDISPLRPRETEILKTGGGWTTLARDIDAVVLFASGFEDIIRPASCTDGLCHKWKRMPKEKDYLAASVEILDMLYERAGHRLTRENLTTTGIKWHRGPQLFERCTKPFAFDCNCNRIQELTPLNAIGKGHFPTAFEVKGAPGAVIFGRGGLCRSVKMDSKKEPGLFGQPNITLPADDNDVCSPESVGSDSSSTASRFHDSGIGCSAVASEEEPISMAPGTDADTLQYNGKRPRPSDEEEYSRSACCTRDDERDDEQDGHYTLLDTAQYMEMCPPGKEKGGVAPLTLDLPLFLEKPSHTRKGYFDTPMPIRRGAQKLRHEAESAANYGSDIVPEHDIAG